MPTRISTRLPATSNWLLIAALSLILFRTMDFAQSDTGNIPPQWQTTAERTNYKQTSTYDEAIAYSKRLAGASGGLITYSTYGKSGEGRDLPLLIAASDRTFTPALARKAGKAV